MIIESKGLAETIARMQGRTERVQHLEPALDVFGQSIVKLTDDKFQLSHDWDGVPFAQLQPSTIAARARRYAGGQAGIRSKRKTLRAKLETAGHSRGEIRKQLRSNLRAYTRKKQKLNAPKAIKILVDTARARNSNHVDPPDPTSLTWSAVGYLGYHMTGTKRMVARNPSAFVYEQGHWQMHPVAAKSFDTLLTAYILHGDAGLSGAA